MNSPGHRAVYNSRIAEMSFSHPGLTSCRLAGIFILVILLALVQPVVAADWSSAEQELARKITATTGPGAISLEVVNRSSLSKQDTDEISRGLRAQLEALGTRTVKPEQAAATVAVSLSENPQSYVWVAEIHQGAGELSVVMVSTPRPDEPAFVRESPALTIRKTPLWAQSRPILDVAVMDESATPTHIAVLDPEQIALYRMAEGRWQLEQSLPITHSRPWPRDMPLHMQAKLLRVLEEGEVERVGGEKPVRVDVRVLVATHRDLAALAKDGKFREDLFHRIYVFPLVLPPLRERREDIPALVEHFAKQVCSQNGWKPIPFASEAMEALREYAWPGNVRELRNVVERLILLSSTGEVDLETVRLALPQGAAVSSTHTDSGALADRVQTFEREVLLAELKRANYNVAAAARALHLERSHLYKKAEQLGVDLRAVRKDQESSS